MEYMCGVIGPDKKDERDYKYVDHLAGVDIATVVSTSHDSDFSLKPFIGKILNQGNTNSCTGHSAMYGMNVILNRINGDKIQNYKINPWWVYYWARQQSGLTQADKGAYMRDLMKALQTYGVYSNSMIDPFSDPGKYDLDDAFTIYEYFRMSDAKGTDEVEYALSTERLPVFACIAIYDGDIDKSTGIFSGKSLCKFAGYHAICLTGVKTINDIKYIQFANSWGSGWGDNGFGYIHPRYFKDSELITDMYCPTYKYN